MATNSKNSQILQLIYLENLFLGPKVPANSLIIKNARTYLVGHMPNYIYTNFQVIWFTFVVANSKNSQIPQLFYLENRFMGQKYLQTASKVNMPLINLVGHMPKYIYTNFQVIWFTFVATNSKNSQIRQLFYLENQCLWPQMWTKWLANWYRYTLAYAQQDLLVAFLILRLFAGTSGP